MSEYRTNSLGRLVSILWDILCILLSTWAARNALGHMLINRSRLQSLDELIERVSEFPTSVFPVELIGATLCAISAIIHIILFLRKKTIFARKFRKTQNSGVLIIVVSEVIYFVAFISFAVPRS